MIVGLVGCSKLKAPRACVARDLYTSPLFRATLAASLRTCDVTMILSARHGLVDLEEWIAPYDMPIGDLNREAAATWGRRVREQLVARFFAPHVTEIWPDHGPPHRLVFFAGRAYEIAVSNIDGVEAVTPLRGLFIGHRITACNSMAADAFRRAPATATSTDHQPGGST